MARELNEELGITLPGLKRSDFFLHRNGKIVLAYTASVPSELVLTPSRPELEIGVWVAKDDFESIDIDPGYKRFVLKNWPVSGNKQGV